MKHLEYIADSKAYTLIDKVASSYYWSLYEAEYDHGKDHDTVLIKVFNLNQKDDMYPLSPLINEIFVAKKCCEHTNIVRYVYCSFKEQNQLCVVMPNPNPPKKPLPSVSVFKHDLPEEIVAFVIMETLKALECIHGGGKRVHGNLVCTSVFLDEEANVKLEFPTWLTDPKLDVYPSSDKKFKKNDFSMVGRLAYDLFNGRGKNSGGCFTFLAKKMQSELLGDFVKFCGSSRGPNSINELMSHQFLHKFRDLDKYKKDLKILLKNKLR